ncbi:hypothetical protein ACFX12_014668 [Malus domestica]
MSGLTLSLPASTNDDKSEEEDKVIAVRSLIKSLLVYGKERKEIRDSSAKEVAKWEEGALSTKDRDEKEFLGEEVETAIHMAECIYDLDWPDDVPKGPKLVEFFCTELDKPALEVQDPLETINLGTKEDPRPIQISGLLKVGDWEKKVDLLREFKDCFAWYYIEMPRLDSFIEIEESRKVQVGPTTPRSF